MRRPSALAAGAGLAAMLLWIGVAYASVDELPVRVRPAQELLPAGAVDAETDDEYLTWAQSRRRHRDRFDAYLSIGDEPKIKLNTRGQGWAGGIDVAGGVVVYQQARRGNSNIRIYDLGNGRRTTAGRRVSSDRHWEYDPAVSGRWLVFARLNWRARPDVRKVLLYDRFAGTKPTVLAEFVGGHRKGTLVNADINGDWVTWTRCRHRFEICDVFRYRISTGEKVRLPRPAEHLHYASSIDADGTVYYMESGLGCGVHVTIRRHAIDSTDEALGTLPAGVDVYSADAVARPDGSTDVVYDRIRCDAANWDIYKVTIAPPGDGGISMLGSTTRPAVLPRRSHDAGGRAANRRASDPALRFEMGPRVARPSQR